MLTDISDNYTVLFQVAASQLPFMGYLLLVVWAINIFNWIFGSPFNLLGIYPRSLWGLMGIIFSPILHANFNHLFFNSIPFFVLGMFLLTLGQSFFIMVTICISLVQCTLVWLFARKAIHIGASGLISGYFGFILGVGVFCSQHWCRLCWHWWRCIILVRFYWEYFRLRQWCHGNRI